MPLLILAPAAVITLSFVLLIAIRYPKLYMWAYLIVSTKFLGFIELREFEVQGIINITFYLNVITILATLIALRKKELPSKIGIRFLFAIAGIIVFGVLYPVVLGYSDIASSITDGKDFLCYFFLAYLLVNRDSIRTQSINDILTFIGLCLSGIVIFTRFTGITPPAYLPVDPSVGAAEGIHIAFSTYIAIACLMHLVHIVEHNYTTKHLVIISILFIGCLLQPHRSVFFAVLAGAAFILLYIGPARLKVKVMFAVPVILAIACFYLEPDTLSNVFIEPVREIFEQSGAIRARININAFRWQEIYNRPILGHGFIDESSSFGLSFYLDSESRFKQTLGTIDAGYVDCLVRFGIAGTVLFSALYLWIISLPFRIKKYASTERIIAAVYLCTYFIISLTWSVFSYKHGIIPAVLAIFIIIRPEMDSPDDNPALENE